MIFWLVLAVIGGGGLATVGYGMREGDNRTIGAGALIIAVAVLALAWHVTHTPDKKSGDTPSALSPVQLQHAPRRA